MAPLNDKDNVREKEILQHITHMLGEIASNWDVAEICRETQLGELGLESINLVYLIAEVQQYYNLQDLLFQRLVAAQIPITQLRVGDLVGFVREILMEVGSD